MRKYTSVDAVGTALLGAIGMLGACGGSVGIQAGGDSGSREKTGGPDASVQGPQGGGPSPEGDAGTGPQYDAPTVVAPSACTQHPCAGASPIVVGAVDTGYDVCQGGTIRRRALVTCPSLLPRAGGGSCTADGGGAGCASDKDCTASPYGHCESVVETYLNISPTPVGCQCNYGCQSDSDCNGGSICLCGDPVGACVPSECSVGSGCLPGCDCAQPRTYGEFACQTPEDTCFSDPACVGAPTSWDAAAANLPGGCGTLGGQAECGPRSYGERFTTAVPFGFTCQPQVMCGTGRPFLVHGAERLAECVGRADWRADLAPDVASCSDALRARVAAHWARVGAMEHASVAAFARFTLHLLSLGAPAELVRLSQQATGDETEHACLAFALASRHAGQPLGPGPLSIQGSLDGSGVPDIVSTLIREGCIGETLAAIEALEGLEHALDPAVRTALEIIARDELRHAELAWKALAWLLESGKAGRATLRDEVTRALRDMLVVTPGSDPGDDLQAFGVVGPTRRAELREQAAKQVVTRCVDSLVGRAASTRTARGARRSWSAERRR